MNALCGETSGGVAASGALSPAPAGPLTHETWWIEPELDDKWWTWEQEPSTSADAASAATACTLCVLNNPPESSRRRRAS